MTMLWTTCQRAGFSAPGRGKSCLWAKYCTAFVLSASLFAGHAAHAQWTATATGEFPEINELSSLHAAAFNNEQGSFTLNSFATTSAGALFSAPELSQGQHAMNEFRRPDQAPVIALRGSGDYQPLSAITGRFQMELNGGTYLFALPTLTRMRFGQNASKPGPGKPSGAEWVMGVGAGMGFRFSEKVGAEFTYEQIEHVDVYSVGARFRF